MGSCGSGKETNRGLRRGYGLGFRRSASTENGLSSLENEKKTLEEELAALKEEKAALENEQN
jgi:hypothetical protein